MRLLLYGAGGGAGHVVRSLAIIRSLVRREWSDPIDLVVSSPFIKVVKRFIPNFVNVHSIPPIQVNSRKEVGKRLLKLFQKNPYDVVLVDTFLFGRWGEFPRLWQKKQVKNLKWIYLFRRLQLPYELEVFQTLSNSTPYQNVIVPNCQESRTFDHIPSELRTACQKLVSFTWTGHIVSFVEKEEEKCIIDEKSTELSPLLCHIGPSYEIEVLKRCLKGLDIHNYNIRDRTNLSYPLSPQLRRRKWICGGSGYNFTAEAVLSGRPALLFPFPREVDDQLSRLDRFASLYPNIIPLNRSNAVSEFKEALKMSVYPISESIYKRFSGAETVGNFLEKLE